MKKTVKISLGILSAVAIALVGMKFMPGNEDTKVAEDTKAAIEKEIETKNEKELTPEELKAALDKIEIAEKPSEISHPKKEEVEKPEDMITVTPVTPGQPIATSTKEPVKKEDDSKKVNTVVKPEPVKPVVTENKKKTETKPSAEPTKPTETKPKETKKPSINDYRGELPDYGGDGPTPASETTEMGKGIDFDELNKNN